MKGELQGHVTRIFAFFMTFVLSITFFMVAAPAARSAEAPIQNGVGDIVPGWNPYIGDVPEGLNEGPGRILPVNPQVGEGWCIDLYLPTPKDSDPNLYKEARVLTHTLPLITKEKVAEIDQWKKDNPDKRNKQELVDAGVLAAEEFSGERRDVVIFLTKNLLQAHRDKNHQEVSKLNYALQILLNSNFGDAQRIYEDLYKGNSYSISGGAPPLTNNEFESLTGYKVGFVGAGSDRTQYYIERTGNSSSPIPKAGPGEYITVVAPEGYNINTVTKNPGQRVITPDQPGLDNEKKKPVIKTEAAFGEGATQAVAGATVNDTVTYEDLVPGKQYTLEAELKSKAEGNPVVGSGSATFTASESGSGEVVVPIKVNDDVTEPVEAAVAFETLKSDDAEAQENKAEGLPEGSADDVIAEHKDIDDEDQTVTSAEDQQAKIELKKYIGNQEFTGEEKPQAGGAGSDGVIDAQDTDNAYVAKVGQELTVTFAVKNSGALDLKDVTVSDELITGEGFESSELSAITPEKQDIKVGETKYFTATLTAPAAGKFHGDNAKTAGIPVDEQGSEVPFKDDQDKRHEPGTSVESNEDQAHATTPERDLAPKIATSASVSKDSKVETFDSDEDQVVYDSVTVENLVEGASYTLDAQLMKKSDSSEIAGATGSKTFTADESGLDGFVKNDDGSVSGSVVVEIPLKAGLLESGDSAVAFEELTSKVVDAKGNETPDASEPNAIAEHKDINDAKQTVTYEVKDETKPNSGKPSESVPPSEQPENPVVNPSDDSSDEPTPSSKKPEPQPSSEEPVETEEPTTSVTSEPAEPSDLEPSIKTSVDPKTMEIAPGGKVVDTVSYEGLKPGTEYTLRAQMVDKDDQNRVIGSGEKTFTTPDSDEESVDGSVDVDISFNADAKDVSSAVAFEELTSKVVDAKGNETPDASEPNAIAEHKDINDAAQTVNSEEKPGTPKLELKKYIGTQEFTGEEKLQDQPGADGVVDAQDPSKAFVAKDADQELTVTFVVTNTGGLDLKDVSVADELTDADTAGIELGEITPAKQDIKVGESVNFTATIKAPEAGKLHADEAKASGVPVDENGNEVPWTDADGKEHKPGEKVDSNVDPAHAKTPKPDEPTEEPSKPAKPSEKEPTPSEPVKPGEPGKPNEPKPGKPSDSAPEPKITTDAMIEDHGALVAGATVVDTVSFSNLVPGKKYELSAELMCKASGNATGATAKVTFLARVADGQINVPIAVTDGDCSEQVVFETLRNADGDVVAVHHDINDEAQTVTAQDVLKPAPSDEVKAAKKDKNVTVVTEGAPEVGKAVAPKTPRRSIKAIPSGSLVFEEGMPSQI